MQSTIHGEMCQDIENTPYDQSCDPKVLAQQAIAKLEKLNSVLDDTEAYWLHGMIDVLRVYAEQLPVVPNRMLTVHSSDGIILRRGLQSFVVGKDEFDEVRNAFRRSNHYRKRQAVGSVRRRLTTT